MLPYNITLNGKTVLVTGVAGFIGSNLAKRLLTDYADLRVVGIDSITDYYDVTLKYDRLKGLEEFGDRFVFIHDSIANREIIIRLFDEYKPSIVVNLAAQAGVRYSITNPDAYVESNLIGFTTFWKPVDTATTTDKPGLNIWFTPPHPAYTVRIKRCPIRRMIKLIIRYRCMPRPKSRMNCWHTHTPSCITYLRPDYASLRFMAPPVVQTWPTSDLRTSW